MTDSITVAVMRVWLLSFAPISPIRSVSRRRRSVGRWVSWRRICIWRISGRILHFIQSTESFIERVHVFHTASCSHDGYSEKANKQVRFHVETERTRRARTLFEKALVYWMRLGVLKPFISRRRKMKCVHCLFLVFDSLPRELFVISWFIHNVNWCFGLCFVRHVYCCLLNYLKTSVRFILGGCKIFYFVLVAKMGKMFRVKV